MAEAEISNQPGARLTNTELVEKYMPAWQLANDMRTSRAFEELGRVINDNFDQILTIEAKAKQIRPGWDDDLNAGRLTKKERFQKLQETAALLDRPF